MGVAHVSKPLVSPPEPVRSDLRRAIQERSFPVPESGCWLWDGPLNPTGYGIFFRKPFPKPAHRVSYLVFKGDIEEGLCICHKCDTPMCVNPDHLFKGTLLDNMRDRAAKKRYLGEWNGRSKLTLAQVLEIKENPGVMNVTFARRFGVTKHAIIDIRKGRTWTHLNEEKTK